MTERARDLRGRQTEAEQTLWYYLRAGRFMGVKFKRQKPIGNYIVDFVSSSHGLIIEIDGGQHAEQQEYDRNRDAWLRSQGYEVVRFWNHQVLTETQSVLEAVRQAIQALPTVSSDSTGACERGDITSKGS
ncbi:endonuclease domain-containing protein [Alcanivorax sp. S6407]|uniref:endonuclease domain-containing protein n=1 Tax=Alcanivorax sp. S6407 TaxID=2926424 RepID=UPI001FF2FA25|nr:endonuclease domain-containing protein [Alcanivorax sp. S6407]MCK0155062.1 endonuclease domain-containing protein [Alcanivorax sp. S6407]